MSSIAALLANRDTLLLPTDDAVGGALARLEVAKRIWSDYPVFARLRLAIEKKQSFSSRSRQERQLVEFLLETGWIQRSAGAQFGYADLEAAYFLGTRGNYWLEELAYFALLESGADEALLRQRLEWSIDGIDGSNEIDAIGRRGKILSFVSCKAFAPTVHSQSTARKRLWNAVMEASYWDTHFADGCGRAVFLVSTDLFDEVVGQSRFPTLAARAKVLDVDLMGLDNQAWDILVAAFRDHWEGER